METRALNLIKSEYGERKRRIFPRFPYCYLTFKGQNTDGKVFEVRDISFSGMQLSLKDGGHCYKEQDRLRGILHWKGAELSITGKVQWVKGARLGVEFDSNDTFIHSIKNFLSIDNIVSRMRPVHDSAIEVEMPENLKYWLRSDGPFEVFVWCHNDGEISKFQIILMDQYIEWADGKGVDSGRILTKRDLETPLFSEDEFLFESDINCDEKKIDLASKVVENLPEEYLTSELVSFMLVKLSNS